MRFQYVDLEFEKLNNEIIELSQDRPNNFIEIGRKLRFMNKAEVYKEGGYDDFYEYVISLEDTPGRMDYSTAQDMIGIFKHYFSLLWCKWNIKILEEIGWSKLRELMKYSRIYGYGIKFFNTHFRSTLNDIFSSPEKEIIHLPITLNVTEFLNKGLHETKKTIKEDFKKFKKDFDLFAIHEGDDKRLGPPMRTIEKNWHRVRFRMYCTYCGEYAVDCFKVERETNVDEGSDLIKSTYFAVTSQGTKFKKLLEVEEAKRNKKKESPDITLRMMSLLAERSIKLDFTFVCRNCNARQYILQLDHEIINQ